MVKIVAEELWRDPGNPGMIVVTTNAIVQANGALVMGSGAALEAVVKIDGIAKECGEAVLKHGSRYGFIEVREPKPDEGSRGKRGFGILQTKFNYKERSDLSLVQYSLGKLAEYAQAHPDVKIRVNFPGIGSGRLKREQVEPLLAGLPDNVTVCTKPFFSTLRVCERGGGKKSKSTGSSSTSRWIQNRFSNMLSFEEPLVFQGISYQAPENFYQAMLYGERIVREQIAKMSPWEAKKYASHNWEAQRYDANVDKLGIMLDALTWKFQPGTQWHKELHATTGEVVLYANWSSGRFWERMARLETDGTITPLDEGENWNGRILTVIRDKNLFDPEDIGRNWPVKAAWLTKLYAAKIPE
jgi:predicted NAD-dependent protein-ADP-ribosyltransferase YbiA (DUF1768 family)